MEQKKYISTSSAWKRPGNTTTKITVTQWSKWIFIHPTTHLSNKNCINIPVSLLCTAASIPRKDKNMDKLGTSLEQFWETWRNNLGTVEKVMKTKIWQICKNSFKMEVFTWKLRSYMQHLSLNKSDKASGPLIKKILLLWFRPSIPSVWTVLHYTSKAFVFSLGIKWK